jgi:hypothetical protein
MRDEGRSQRRALAAGALAFFCALGCAGQSAKPLEKPLDLSCLERPVSEIRVGRIPRSDLDALLDGLVRDNAGRAAAVERLLREAGCEDVSLEAVTGSGTSGLPNVICRLPGRSARRIVVGAHYDKVKVGDGASDNWSGAMLLPALYTSLATREREHSFEFIAFADEEDGLLGSRSHVRGLSDEQRNEIAAMVNIDTLGLGVTKAERSSADPEFLCLLVASIRLLETPVELVNVERVGTSDFASFATAGVRVINIHSLEQDTFPILHSRKDTLEAIDRAAYYDTYRLLAVYMGVLDQSLSRPAAPPAGVGAEK